MKYRVECVGRGISEDEFKNAIKQFSSNDLLNVLRQYYDDVEIEVTNGHGGYLKRRTRRTRRTHRTRRTRRTRRS